MTSSLLPILQKAFPTESIISYKTTKQIIQANAEGHLVSVLLHVDDDDDDDVDVDDGETETRMNLNKTKSCFVKTMDANHHYKKKKHSWPDFRRTLMYIYGQKYDFIKKYYLICYWNLPSHQTQTSHHHLHHQ
mmetsp:Transcript_42642/g.48134  ORF Transcript_42642/g.48134 Transcript_42642/m.48134 type:complete len:133 (+) Transcript_42642:149-547(+)